MKLSVILALLALIGTPVWACPDLAGQYTCQADDGTQADLSVTQQDMKDANGKTYRVYSINDNGDAYDVIADAVTRTDQGQTEDGNTVTYTETNTCNGTKSVTSVMAYSEVDASGKSVTSFDASQVFSKTAKGAFKADTTYTENGSTQEMSVECAVK